MMEIEAASTPRGTPPSSNCLSSMSQLRQQPAFQQQHQLNLSPTNLPRGLKTTLRDNGVVITPQLTSQSVYEVTSSAQGNNYTVTTSPHLSTLNRIPLTKSASNSTSSPDSAIHSASYYSPSQSPVDHNQQNSIVSSQQSRNQQISGLSSPFSFRNTPASSLSRTNSDASQYGSSSLTSIPSSVSATTSPISHSHQYSPNNSPSQARHHSGGVGVVFVDQDDLTRDCTFPERSILFSDFVITDPVVNPNGKDEGPFPFIPLKLFRLETVAETNAADDEHVDEGDEEDVLGALELIAPPGRGPLWGSVFGSV